MPDQSLALSSLGRIDSLAGAFSLLLTKLACPPLLFSPRPKFLQRGAQLRNTPWVYGLVVYTGHESKLLKNSKAAPIKRSNVDDIYNRQIIYMFFALVCLLRIPACGRLTLASSIISHVSPLWLQGRAITHQRHFLHSVDPPPQKHGLVRSPFPAVLSFSLTRL